jgi:tetratricopeptide (TPR) repeat protein
MHRIIREIRLFSLVLTCLIMILSFLPSANAENTTESQSPEYIEPPRPPLPPQIYTKSRDDLYNEWKAKTKPLLPGLKRPGRNILQEGEGQPTDARSLPAEPVPSGRSVPQDSIHDDLELKQTVDSLLAVLYGGDDLKSIGAQNALVKHGPRIVPFLLEVACERSNRVQINNILSESGIREATYNNLYHKLIFDSESLCWSDAELLISLSRESVNRKGILTKLYALPDRIIKVKVLHDLADYGQKDYQFRELLLNALASKDECLHQNAERILRQVGPPAVDDLLSMMKTGDISVKCRAAGVIGGMGPVAAPAVPEMIELYETSEGRLQSVILRSLGEIGTPKELIIPRLIRSLDDKDPGIRETAIDGIVLLRDRIKEALPKLRSIMAQDPDEFVRGHARVYVSGSEKDDLAAVSNKGVYLLFIISFGFVAFLFIKQKNMISMAHVYLVAACFGHPLYLVAACYIAITLDLGDSGSAVNNGSINVIVYITILLSFFLLRFWFFLYLCWFRSRLSITSLIRYALVPFVRAHKYCVWGLPFLLLIPLAVVNQGIFLLIIFVPVILILCIAAFLLGLFQSISTIKTADPVEWDSYKELAPSDTLDELSGKSSETRQIAIKKVTIKEKVAVHLATLTLLVLIALLAAASGPDAREKTSGAEIEVRRLLLRQTPATAGYYTQKGDNYMSSYYLNRTLPGGAKERYHLAINEYDKALAIDPRFSKAYEGRANAYILSEENQKAIDDLNQVEVLEQGLRNDLYVRRGTSYRNLGLDDKMCEDFKRACCSEECPGYNGAVKDGFCKKLSK